MSKLVIPGVVAQSGNGGGGGGYVLPTATANRLGGIKVGENLTVEADGTLNAQAGSAPQNTNPLEKITCEEDNVVYTTITIDESEIELEAPYFDSLSEEPTTPLHFIGVLPAEYADSGTTWEYEIVQYKANEAWYHLIGTDMVFCIERDAEIEDILMEDTIYPLEAMLPNFQKGSTGNKQLIQKDNSDDVIKWITDNKLENTATGNGALTILGTSATGTNQINIGTGTKITSGNNSILIGSSTTIGGHNEVIIGSSAKSGGGACVIIGSDLSGSGWTTYTTSIGYGCKCSGSGNSNRVMLGSYCETNGSHTIAIGGGYGAEAKALANNAIQLGTGSNSTAKTLQVYEYQLLDGNTGKIPVERLPDIAGGGSAPVEKDFSNITGTTLATGLTLNVFQIISVYKNGVLLTETSQTNPNQDYTISENDLIFTTALVASDKVKLIGYAKLDGASALSELSYTELNASGFDGTSGLQLASAPFSGIQSSDNWELVVCLTPDTITGSGDSSNNLLYSRYPDSSKMSTDFLAIGSSQRIRIYLSSNGTSNDIANAVDTNCYLVPNKKQWIKLAYTSGTYTIDQSFDGSTYANKWTLANAAQIYNGADAITAFGIHATVPALRMHGILHLDETYISINGTKVFDGSDSSDYVVIGDGLTIGETINKELILTPSNIPGYNANVTQYLKHVNNETQWAEVEPIKTLTTSSTELENNCVYNGGELASVTVTLPSTVPVNFCCKVQFSSGTTATVFSGSGIYFEGDACLDGTFTPIASHRYSIMITNDGVNTIGFVYQK